MSVSVFLVVSSRRLLQPDSTAHGNTGPLTTGLFLCIGSVTAASGDGGGGKRPQYHSLTLLIRPRPRQPLYLTSRWYGCHGSFK